MCRILTTLALSRSLCCCYPPYRPSLYILYRSHPLRRIFWMGYLDKVLFSSPPPLHPMIFFSRAGMKTFSKKFSIRKCDILCQHFCKNPTFWWIFLRKKLTFSIDNSIFQRNELRMAEFFQFSSVAFILLSLTILDGEKSVNLAILIFDHAPLQI